MASQGRPVSPVKISGTTPTIVRQGAVERESPDRIRLPNGLSDAKYRRTNDSLTTATGSDSSRSSRERTRPSTAATSNVWKNPGETVMLAASG
jgi:hypothetical protein